MSEAVLLMLILSRSLYGFKVLSLSVMVFVNALRVWV